MKSMKILKKWLRHKINVAHLLANSEAVKPAQRAVYQGRHDAYLDILLTIKLMDDSDIAEMLKGGAKNV